MWAAVSGVLNLSHDEIRTNKKAQCKFELSPEWKTKPPVVHCRESWVRADWDWHAGVGGVLCYILDEQWKEVQRPLPDLEIDHFRPKNAVAKTKHAGYWWLAFDWENFRIASALANKRRTDDRAATVEGKGTYFPLVKESKRVGDKKPAPTKGEKPILLDPFDVNDVILLDYSPEDGKVVEKFSAKKDKEKNTRAKSSIEFYHLNEGSLISRRSELSVALADRGDLIEELFSKREGKKGLSAKEEKELARLQGEVGGFINATAEFSAFCRACLQQRGSRGWNGELLVTV